MTLTRPTEQEPRGLTFKTFFECFLQATGALPTVLISVSLAFSMGCTVAVVPEILSDRYARLYHGYDSVLPCSSFTSESMPIPCRRGSDNAQDASAWSSMLQNLMTLFCSPAIGRMSDVYGRRRIYVFSTFLYTLGPIMLIGMQIFPMMDPLFYYLANSLIGVVSYIGMAFAILADSMPGEFRAPSFGIVMAGFYGGFAFSPFLAIVLNHLHVSIVSALLAGVAFLYTLIGFPETLPELVRENNVQQLSEQFEEPGDFSCRRTLKALTRPFHDMAILNRDSSILLVAVGSFFSSMVYSSDANLVVFYIEQYLNVREQDIAFQFLLMGMFGVFMQAIMLQPMLLYFGEKRLLIISFLSGTLHNFLYGMAKNKATIFLALCLSQLTKTNTPILASLASKDASVNEQGQIQGALYALNALSAAVGPVTMQFIYRRTKDSIGPGTMFVFASFLYFVGTIVVSFIPSNKVEEVQDDIGAEIGLASESLEAPLLPQSTDTS